MAALKQKSGVPREASVRRRSGNRWKCAARYSWLGQAIRCLSDSESYQFLGGPGAALAELRRLEGLPAGWHVLNYPSSYTNTQRSDLWILNEATHLEEKS